MVSAGLTNAMPSRARLGPRALRVLALLILLAAWEGAARSGLVFERVVPPIHVIGGSLIRQLLDSTFYVHLAVTTGEVLGALAIGGVAGVLVGLAIGCSRALSAGGEPILYYLAPTPKIVFLPIVLVAFGVDAGSKVAIGTLSAFFPIAMSTVAGMHEVSKIHLDVGRSFRLRPSQMMLYIHLPSLRAHLITGLRLGLGLAVIGVMLAETKLSNRGIGFLAIQYYNTFRTSDLYAILAVIFFMTSLLNVLMERLERRGGAA